MLVMAFDIATSTGVAFGRVGEVPRTTTINLGRVNQDAKKFAKVGSMVSVLLTKYKPDLVVFEAPIGGPKTSHFLVGAAAVFTGRVEEMGFRCEQVHSSTARKHFMGRALQVKDFPGKNVDQRKKALKQVIIDRCYLLGWKVQTDDEADACAIWDYACATYGRAQSIPAGGLFTKQNSTGV